MYRKCTTERAAAQQQIIQQCLLDAVQNRPYQEITVTSLCEAANLSRKTFYRLFDSKDDVFCALIDQVLRQFEAEQLPARTVYTELHRMFSYWRRQEVLVGAVAKNHLISMLAERFLHYLTYEDPVTKYWVGAIDHPFSKEILVYFASGIMGLLINWHHTGYSRSTEEMAQIAVQILTQAPLHLPEEML